MRLRRTDRTCLSIQTQTNLIWDKRRSYDSYHELSSLNLVHRMKSSAFGLVVVFSFCFNFIFEFSHIRPNKEKKITFFSFLHASLFRAPAFFYFSRTLVTRHSNSDNSHSPPTRTKFLFPSITRMLVLETHHECQPFLVLSVEPLKLTL